MGAITGLPGYRTAVDYTPRRARKSSQGANYLEGGAVIDGTRSGDAGNTSYVDVLRPGKIMAKRSSGGKYRNYIIGKTTASYTGTGTVTSLTVGAATATEIARLIAATGASVTALLVGPPSAAGTVAETAITISAASGTTLTIADLAVDKVTDSLIVVDDTVAGSLCIVDDDDFVKCSDELGNRIDQPFARPLIGGNLDTSQIIDWPADTSTITWLKGKLNAAGSNSFFRFDE